MENTAKAKAKVSARRNMSRRKAMYELGLYKKNSYKTFCVVIFVTLLLIGFWQLNNRKVAQINQNSDAVVVQSTSKHVTNMPNDDEASLTVETPVEVELIGESTKLETSVEDISEAEDNSEVEDDSETYYEDKSEEKESVTSLEGNNDEFIISLNQKELGMIVQAVQHEVGTHENFYPNADLDFIQQCMARVIINQVGRPGYGFHDTVYEVLAHPGHFMPLEELEPYDPAEPRTLSNVLTVLRGEDSISKDVIFEMSFLTLDLNRVLEIMEEQVGKVNIYFSTVTAEGRLLVFAEPATV